MLEKDFPTCERGHVEWSSLVFCKGGETGGKCSTGSFNPLQGKVSLTPPEPGPWPARASYGSISQKLLFQRLLAGCFPPSVPPCGTLFRALNLVSVPNSFLSGLRLFLLPVSPPPLLPAPALKLSSPSVL